MFICRTQAGRPQALPADRLKPPLRAGASGIASGFELKILPSYPHKCCLQDALFLIKDKSPFIKSSCETVCIWPWDSVVTKGTKERKIIFKWADISRFPWAGGMFLPWEKVEHHFLLCSKRICGVLCPQVLVPVCHCFPLLPEGWASSEGPSSSPNSQKSRPSLPF